MNIYFQRLNLVYAIYERTKYLPLHGLKQKPGFIIDILIIRERKFPELQCKDTKNNIPTEMEANTFFEKIFSEKRMEKYFRTQHRNKIIFTFVLSEYQKLQLAKYTLLI